MPSGDKPIKEFSDTTLTENIILYVFVISVFIIAVAVALVVYGII